MKPTPKILNRNLPAGAVTLQPRDLNNMRFSKDHTVITPKILETPDAKTPKS